MVAASMLKLMVVCLSVFWIISFSVGRIFIFYEAYTQITLIQKQDEWLRLQCSDPNFYTNMRQHADLCAQVQLNFQRIPFLVGLNAVANTAHLCGRHSCADAVIYVSNGGWPVLVTVALTCMMAPMLVMRVTNWLVCDHGLKSTYGAQLPISKMA
jgi:hypothetical protein